MYEESSGKEKGVVGSGSPTDQCLASAASVSREVEQAIWANITTSNRNMEAGDQRQNGDMVLIVELIGMSKLIGGLAGDALKMVASTMSMVVS